MTEGERSRLVISEIGAFGDFLWDLQHGQELLKLEPAAVLDGRASQRRVVIQSIHGQLRYWATTSRGPAALASDEAICELGTVDSLGRAASLCREFLIDGRELRDVTVDRDVLRRSSDGQ